MEILKIVLFAVAAVVATVLVKQLKSEFAVVVAVCASVLLTISVCDKLFEVVYAFYNFSTEAGVDDKSVSCVIKVVGIGYLAEFANNLCVDCGCKSIGDKVLLASKISILFCALPVVEQLFSLIQSLVG